MFLESSSTNIINFVQVVDLIGCHGSRNVLFYTMPLQFIQVGVVAVGPLALS